MRLLLDENLDWRLARDLPGHETKGVTQLGWSGIKNGTLLRRAVSEGFEVLLTMDSAMVHEQNLAQFAIALIALRAPSNRLADIRPLMPRVLNLLPTIRKGTLTVVP
jgi:predicted nuclease of predicted toxin-antitoxin system